MPDKTEVETHFTGEEKAALMKEIFTLTEVTKKLRDFTDAEIGELLFHHVWANINMLTPQSSVIEQAFLRLGFNPGKKR